MHMVFVIAACSGGGYECELKQSKGDTISTVEVRLYIMSLVDSLGENMHEIYSIVRCVAFGAEGDLQGDAESPWKKDLKNIK